MKFKVTPRLAPKRVSRWPKGPSQTLPNPNDYHYNTDMALQDEKKFWQVGDGFDELEAVPQGEEAVLEKLGTPPFAKSKFPFLGFLASVYDHVVDRIRQSES